MKKIPTLFVRDPDDLAHVTREVTVDCDWVLAGEGTPTRKYDGTCMMFDGSWWSRREVKAGKPEPEGWVEVDADPVTGKRVGWEPVAQSSFYRWFLEAIEPYAEDDQRWVHGTYELIGPKVNGGRDGSRIHSLRLHALAPAFTIPEDRYSYDGLRDILVELLREHNIEGLVWHHPDGRMAKLKGKDFA